LFCKGGLDFLRSKSCKDRYRSGAVEHGRIELLPALKQYFGFTSFRPLQEEIIRDALAGKDVFALLPTGGGKSLCFQMPAMVRPGLTVVVSPLIALMKDQVDGLQAGGVPATFLNSSLESSQSRSRLRGLHQGEYRLLYVAPERLMLSGFLADLQRWNVSLLAIDEAHCISEWGHDFRPEYRQLAQLRTLFPTVSIMALTATATADSWRRLLCSQFQPTEPDLSRLWQGQGLSTSARFRAGASERERNHLLPGTQNDGEPRRATE
jgi:superfamily II DNA helicase RecQ